MILDKLNEHTLLFVHISGEELDSSLSGVLPMKEISGKDDGIYPFFISYLPEPMPVLQDHLLPIVQTNEVSLTYEKLLRHQRELGSLMRV